MNQLTQFGPFQAISRFWGTLNNTQRFVTAVFVSLSIVLLTMASVIATRPQMSVLYSGLSASDTGAVVARIQSRGVPYEVTGDGSVVKVPGKHVPELRMALASEGLPQGGSVGFEIFDKSSLGMTEFTQRLNFQRALQGELTRSINELNGVEQARVHIAIPEPSVFMRQDKQPTASVIVKLRPGGRLGGDHVGGIVHLVSSAVEGLKPGNVTVVDTDGNLLSESIEEGGINPRLTATQLSVKREHERQVEGDIQSMIERVLGPNKAIVRVNAKINLDRRETNSETVQPADGGTGVLLNQVSFQETYAPDDTVAETGGNPRGRERGYQRTETTSRYEVSRTTEHVITAPGQIERLSVAVILDDQVEEDKVIAIRNAVEMAAGIDHERGDQITVETVGFDLTAMEAEEQAMAAMAARTNYLSIGKSIGAVLLLFGFLFFIKSMLNKVNVSIPEVTVQEITASGPAVAQAYTAAAAPQPRPGPDPSQFPPEEVAKVVRGWISE